MKRLFQILVIGAWVALLTTLASAQVPQMISYQGKLTTSSGAPLDTTISMVFTIYADSGGTISKWSETQTAVKVEKGVFNVLLGSVNPIPDSVFNGNVRYLGVKVGGDPEITPRKPIVSVPYAYTDGNWTRDGDHIYRYGPVCIGLKTYYSKLTVRSDSAGDGISLLQSGSGQKIFYMLGNMACQGSWNGLVQSGDNMILWKGSKPGNPDACGLVIAPWDSNLVGIRIDYQGNVGIGTPNPQRALHISDVMRLEPRTTAPTNPSEGDIYVSSTGHHIYCYLNGVWKQLDN